MLRTSASICASTSEICGRKEKRLGICTVCGKENAFSPYVRCAACIEKVAIKDATYLSQLDAVRKEKIRASQKQSRQKYFRNARRWDFVQSAAKESPLPEKSFVKDVW